MSGLSLSVRKNSSSPRYRDTNEDCSCSHWAHSALQGWSLGSTFQSRKTCKNNCSSQNIKTMHHTASVLCTIRHWYSLHTCSKIQKPNNQKSGTSLLIFPGQSSHCQFLQTWLPAEEMWIGNNNLQSHHFTACWLETGDEAVFAGIQTLCSHVGWKICHCHTAIHLFNFHTSVQQSIYT